MKTFSNDCLSNPQCRQKSDTVAFIWHEWNSCNPVHCVSWHHAPSISRDDSIAVPSKFPRCDSHAFMENKLFMYYYMDANMMNGDRVRNCSYTEKAIEQVYLLKRKNSTNSDQIYSWRHCPPWHVGRRFGESSNPRKSTCNQAHLNEMRGTTGY